VHCKSSQCRPWLVCGSIHLGTHFGGRGRPRRCRRCTGTGFCGRRRCQRRSFNVPTTDMRANLFFLLFFRFLFHLTRPRDTFHAFIGLVASFNSFLLFY
jgi:hypothetical protein